MFFPVACPSCFLGYSRICLLDCFHRTHTRTIFVTILSFRLSDIGPFIMRKGRKEGTKKSYTQKQHWKSDQNQAFLFAMRREKWTSASNWLGHSREHSLFDVDSDSEREATDMGCDHQQT
ncbi:hypothetical protein AVEN_45198-1 [Araneus ventricosus]|uniref:Uncharacterized protein n=1 Tax=Araneus ventricosus TaxID=182803 RepID=A0A4Y2N5D7_ARAVE|nr:hypothetical protein AVEN_45198-1 [Araneus ventricosus]